jgi:hypothetical protein
MWLLYKRAEKFAARPSEMMALKDSYAAWCLDEVVYFFGTYVEGELKALKKGKKEKDETFAARQQRLFLKLIGQSEQIKFAAPIATK